jgi:hypothetical protein
VVSAGGGLPIGLGDCSQNQLMVLLLRDSLLLCALQMSCVEERVALTECLEQCGLHLYPLLLAVPGPMGVGPGTVCADWLALASLCRLTRCGRQMCLRISDIHNRMPNMRMKIAYNLGVIVIPSFSVLYWVLCEIS